MSNFYTVYFMANKFDLIWFDLFRDRQTPSSYRQNHRQQITIPQ